MHKIRILDIAQEVTNDFEGVCYVHHGDEQWALEFAKRILAEGHFVSVDYLVATGGSGSTRLCMGTLPQWLVDHPGYMVIRITDIS